jgi:hypothetical protein
MIESKPIPSWRPMLPSGAVKGYWVVHAATREAAKMQIEERMIKRGYFVQLREWKKNGWLVEEVEG